MKKLFLLFVMCVCTTFISVFGENYLVDVNLTRDSALWKSAGDYLNNYKLYNNVEIKIHGESEPGCIVHGNYGSFDQANPSIQVYNCENLEEKFRYSFRLARNANNKIEFPEYSNVGTIKFHYYNMSNEYAPKIPLQKEVDIDGTKVWETIDSLDIVLNDGSVSTSVVECDINLSGPVKIKLGHSAYPQDPSVNSPNIQIYAVTITEKVSSNIFESKMEDVLLDIVDRSLQIISTENYTASVYNLSGAKIGDATKGETFFFTNQGYYIVKVNTGEKTITKKVFVF